MAALAVTGALMKVEHTEAKRRPKPGPTPVPSGLVLAADSANTVTSPDWFKQLRAAGFELYIPHTQAWGTDQPFWNILPQLQYALDAGLMIAGYARPIEYWQVGINACGAFKSQLKFWALDAEDVGHPLTREMVTGVQSLGVRPLVYSGWGMWGDVMGGSTAFSDVPLWDYEGAISGIPATLSDQPLTQYGGWNTAATLRKGWQLQWEVPTNGINIDTNVFDRAWLEGNTL